MKIADAKPGQLVWSKEPNQPDSERKLHMVVGWSEVYWDDKGRLLAELPEDAPAKVVAYRAKAEGVMGVSWTGWNRPKKEGERRLLTIEVCGIRDPKPTGHYLMSHTTGRMLDPINVDGDLHWIGSTLSRIVAKSIANATEVTYHWLVWPGLEVQPNRRDLRGYNTFDFGQPEPAEGVMVVGMVPSDRGYDFVTVEDRSGKQWVVDPLDLYDDGKSMHRLNQWKRHQVDDATDDLRQGVRSVLNSMAPDEERGHGKNYATIDGVFLSWQTIQSMLVDGHENAGASLAALVEAGLRIEDHKADMGLED